MSFNSPNGTYPLQFAQRHPLPSQRRLGSVTLSEARHEQYSPLSDSLKKLALQKLINHSRGSWTGRVRGRLERGKGKRQEEGRQQSGLNWMRVRTRGYSGAYQKTPPVACGHCKRCVSPKSKPPQHNRIPILFGRVMTAPRIYLTTTVFAFFLTIITAVPKSQIQDEALHQWSN